MTMDAVTEARLRSGFRIMNRGMVLLWRLALGRAVNMAPEHGGQIMVLTHRGRKSGKVRRTPVNYAEVDGVLHCVAGFGAKTDWYRNIVANPAVEVWLPTEWWAATASEMTDSPERLNLIRKVLVASGFAARLAGIDPLHCDDASLAAFTADYRLVRIDRIRQLEGAGGPGDLAWIWLPLLIVAGLILVGRGSKQSRSPSGRE